MPEWLRWEKRWARTEWNDTIWAWFCVVLWGEKLNRLWIALTPPSSHLRTNKFISNQINETCRVIVREKRRWWRHNDESQNSHDEDISAAWNWCLWSLDKWQWQHKNTQQQWKEKDNSTRRTDLLFGARKEMNERRNVKWLVKMKMMMENLTVVNLSKKKIRRTSMRGKKIRFPLNSKLVLMWFLLW